MKYFIAICIVLVGCAPQKRLNRLIKRHPELVKIDTAIVSDTVHIETIKADTVFKDTTYFRLLRDTITITNDRLTIRQYHTRDSIFIEGECLGDTLIREIKVPYQTVRAVTKEVIPLWIKIFLVGLIICLILLGVRKLKE